MQLLQRIQQKYTHMKFQCTKGMADAEDLNFIVTQQDVVRVTEVED